MFNKRCVIYNQKVASPRRESSLSPTNSNVFVSRRIQWISAVQKNSTFLRTICSPRVSQVIKSLDSLMDKNYVLNKILTLALFIKENSHYSQIYTSLSPPVLPPFPDIYDIFVRPASSQGSIWSKLDLCLCVCSHQVKMQRWQEDRLPRSLRSHPVLRIISFFLLSKCLFSIPAQLWSWHIS